MIKCRSRSWILLQLLSVASKMISRNDVSQCFLALCFILAVTNPITAGLKSGHGNRRYVPKMYTTFVAQKDL